jgi:branched-subunit amino acid transport protein
MMLAILLVGLGSYVLRVVPMLLVDRLRLSRRAEQRMDLAVQAAMVGLLGSIVAHQAGTALAGVPAVAPWAALAAGLVAALLHQSMGRVLLWGMAAYAAVVALSRLL